METFLEQSAHIVSLVLDLIAIAALAIGAVEALVDVARHLLTGRMRSTDRHEIWLRFAHWLVGALTFQLAADIAHTAIAPSWDEIGRLGAIAALRTFISFFLDRDMDRTRERDAEQREQNAPQRKQT